MMIFWLALFCLLMGQCLNPIIGFADEPQLEPMIESQLDWTIESYHVLKQDDDNLVYSPFSAYVVATLLAEASTGETQQEIREAISQSAIDDPVDLLAQQQSQVILKRSLKSKQANELNIASALWVQKGITLQRSFAGALHALDVEFFSQRLSSSAARTESIINRWAQQQTRGRIGRIVSPQQEPSVVDRHQAAFYLANAVYFHSKWKSPFEKSSTRKEDFTLAPGEKVKCSMMHKRMECLIAESTDFRVLRLPYQSKGHELLIFLPLKEDGLPALEQELSPELLSEVFDAFGDPTPTPADSGRGFFMIQPEDSDELQSKQDLAASKRDSGGFSCWKGLFKVGLPRLTFRNRLALKECLQQLNVSLAFDPDAAEFEGFRSPRSIRSPIYLREFYQQCCIEMNEEGTTAAAVTMAGGGFGGAPISRVFIADHPYLFMIRHQPTNTLLFIGRCADPRSDRS